MPPIGLSRHPARGLNRNPGGPIATLMGELASKRLQHPPHRPNGTMEGLDMPHRGLNMHPRGLNMHPEA